MGRKKPSSKVKKVSNNKQNNSLGPAFFVIPLILLVFIYTITFSFTEDNSYVYISPVFKRYDRLEKTEDVYIENYFTDDMGAFYDEGRYRLINESAEYFYDKTGIKIFLLTSNASRDENERFVYPTDEEAVKTCENICNELKPEGIDLVILFMPAKSGFKMWTYATDGVREIYGTKCERMMEQYLNHYFNVVGEYDELFWYSYRSTADRLMGGITSPFAVVRENLRFFILAVLTVSISGASVILYKNVGNKK